MFATVADILKAAVARDRAAPAVVMDDQWLSFAELDRLSDLIADSLVSAGLERRDRVAMCLDKQPLAVACLYGIIKAGGIAVPLDPNGPPGRLRHIMGDAGVALLITGSAKAGRLDEGLGASRLKAILLPGHDGAAAFEGKAAKIVDRPAIMACPGSVPRVDVHGQDLACLLYTSGSTGGPKGVMITHRAICFFAEYASAHFGLRGDDVLSCHAPLHFDLTLFDIYAGHAAGAATCLIPQGISFMAGDLLGYIKAQRITVWQSVPSVLRLLARQMTGGEFASVRMAIFAGEPYPAAELADLMALAPETVFFNIYGATEINDVSCHPVPRPLPKGDLPIGAPWGGAELMLLDDNGREITDSGVVGELWVRGPTVSPGYWNNPSLTAERFTQNPLHDLYPDPVYRTGDRARRDAAGCFHFAGRSDLAVKIRGNRVDPGEIEAALRAHPDIAAAAVIAVSDDAGQTTLQAHVTLKPGATLTDRQLRRHCAQHVPGYMVPARIIFHEALPQTSTGKLDRVALVAKA